MTHQDIVDKLVELCPSTSWVLHGDTYDSLEWRDDPTIKPTAEQLGL
jgi:hypothetical protein